MMKTKRFFHRIICGFFLGLSVFAPGFSGSVIAIIMGIYQDLIRIVSNPFKQFGKNVKFVVPLGIGAVISAVLFVISFKFLFTAYEKATYLLFVGLIFGNFPVIFTEIKKCGFQARYLFGGVAAFAAALALGIFASGVAQTSGAESVSAALPLLAFAGFAAGVTAPIPGMSVSMVLIIMGVYGQLIFAAESFMHMNFTYLLPFGLFGICALAGLVLTSRGIKVIFERFPGFANSLVFGFMAGSLIGIFIQGMRLDDPNFNWLLGGLMLAAGLVVSMLFVVLGKSMNKPEE